MFTIFKINHRVFSRSISTVRGLRAALLFSTGLPLLLFPVSAGVTNPDLSAIGQVMGGYTDSAGSKNSQDPTLRLGEAEIVLDAYLNPYLKGWFTLTGGEDGIGVEEAYTSVVKGLPWGLGLKAGKHRLDFGKVNPSHPHAYAFIDPPRSLTSLLPGGSDGFNETGLQVSDLLPTPGDWASTVSAEVIEGKQFHPGQDYTSLGWTARWANDFLIGDIGALETGLSGASGQDAGRDADPAYLYGGDVKAKFYLPGASQLTAQAEAIYKRGHLSDSLPTDLRADNRFGWLASVDYRYHTQFNGGALYEQWNRLGDAEKTDRAFRVFAGYAVLEESTLLRVAYERLLEEDRAGVNSVSMQLLFSMGPHKAHQF